MGQREYSQVPVTFKHVFAKTKINTDKKIAVISVRWGFYQGGAHRGLLRNRTDNTCFLMEVIRAGVLNG